MKPIKDKGLEDYEEYYEEIKKTPLTKKEKINVSMIIFIIIGIILYLKFC